MTIVLPHGVIYKINEWDQLSVRRKIEVLRPIKDRIRLTSSLSDLRRLQENVEDFFRSEIEKIRSLKMLLEEEASSFSLPPSRVKHLNRVLSSNFVNSSHNWVLRRSFEGILLFFRPIDTLLATAINSSALALQCVEAFMPYRQLVLRNEYQARILKIDSAIAKLESCCGEHQTRLETKISCYEEMQNERESTKKQTVKKHQSLQSDIKDLEKQLENQVQATQKAKNEKGTAEDQLQFSTSEFHDTMERINKEHSASVESLVKRFEERLEKSQAESSKVVQEQNAKFDQDRSDREKIFVDRESRFNQKEAERDEQLQRYELQIRDREIDQAAMRSKTESALFDKISELLNSMHSKSSREEIGYHAQKWSSLQSLAAPSCPISSQNDPLSPKSGISFEEVSKEESYRDQLIELAASSEEKSQLTSRNLQFNAR